MTIITFLIQHTQNRDTLAVQPKLDELIRVTADADELIPAEDDTTEELARLKAHYAAPVEENRRALIA